MIKKALSQLMCLYQFWRVMGKSVICGFLVSVLGEVEEGGVAACEAF